MSFSLNLKKLTEKVGAGADIAVRTYAMNVFSSVTLLSPVDKGTFKGNWQMGIGAVDGTTDSPDDKSGIPTIERAKAKLTNFKSGKTLFISNSLAYARTLEYGEFGTGKAATDKTTSEGYSKQAPQGMVRITLIKAKRIIRTSLK